MADSAENQPQQQTPQKPAYQNGVRTNGRAFNSPNWRLKSEESPSFRSGQDQSQNGESPRRPLGFGRPGQNREREVPQAISEGRRLYVGNMPYTAKMEDVRELFSKGGFEVSRIDIAIDPFSGRNPSYCFVDLETKDLAERAMAELDGADLSGRPVKIKPGVVKSASERQQQQQQRTGFGNGVGIDGSGQGSPRANGSGNGNRSSPFSADRWRRDENTTTPTKSTPFSNSTNGTSTSTSTSNSDPSKRLYVGGLPRLTDAENMAANITNFFTGYNITNVSKLFTPHPAKRFEPGDHYYLFVDFESVEETQNAMVALNGKEGPWGSPIRVQRARGETWNSEERKNAGRWGPSTPAKEGDVEA
ncbi:RNA-binding protein [Aspergillus undulatus]|uniref:RNA-binding protein n=1 Tax=Aspergillus undulatus TaxID=1810928 RepID=UPI003CCCC12B